MRRTKPSIFGLVAEFREPEEIVEAAKHAREAGYRQMDAYTPFPVHGLSEALDFEDNRVPWIIFLSGLSGAILGYLMQVFISVVDFPLNVGGRPYHSWPAFVPVTFECTILLASFGATIGMLALNGLPRPYHPIFNAPRFELASQDRFFLCIEATDPKFDRERTEQFLEGLHPVSVSEVEN
ncbi:MAG TPA: DUF3341 domain-containing protein [Chthonomonadaceae bacterium]|nr:DUF3341 domain-containing protein [Chthonomonadaceae bacterium]